MKVLVTGANGFVGSYLCAYLKSKDYTVFRGLRRASAIPSAEDVVYGDLTTFNDWETPLAQVDVVIHLSARVHQLAENKTKTFSLYEEVNVNVTKRLVQAAIKTGIKKFIFLSTVKVHGEKNTLKNGIIQFFTENLAPAPIGAYAKTKWMAEQLIHGMALNSELNFTILRPPLIYGPGVKANMYRLLNLVKKGYPLPFKSINNLRSFIFVENLCDVIERSITHPNANNNTFLVSDGKAYSTPDLVNELAKSINVSPRLFSIAPKLLKCCGILLGQDKIISRLTENLAIDASHCIHSLSWKPKYNFERALKKSFQL